VVASLRAPAGLYNVGDDEPVTRRAYFAALSGALGVRPPFIAPAALAKVGGPMTAAVTRSQRVSNRAFVDATGWKPAARSVREGWPVVVAATRAGDGATGRNDSASQGCRVRRCPVGTLTQRALNVRQVSVKSQHERAGNTVTDLQVGAVSTDNLTVTRTEQHHARRLFL